MSRIPVWTMALAVALLAACGGSEKVDPPPTPGGVVAAPGDGVVGIRWNAAAGADGYTVYWSTTSGAGRGGGTAIHTLSTGVDHPGLSNGVTYYYVVTAANGGGESPASPEVSATPLPSQYPLTSSVSGTGAGTVTSAPAGIDCGATCAASFPTGSSVTLTATPGATSIFAGWSGACSGSGACAVSMDGAKLVTATFTRITHNLTVSRNGTGTGTVSSSPAGISCGVTCAASFATGSLVTLTATPDATSIFAGWSGACSGTGTCTVSLGAAAAVTATFNPALRTVTVGMVDAQGIGHVTSMPAGIDCYELTGTCSAAFTSGTPIVLIVVPGVGDLFDRWTGACAGQGPTCSLTINSDLSTTASTRCNGLCL